MPLCLRRAPQFALAIALIASPLGVVQRAVIAHDGLGEQIARVSAQIARAPANAALLVTRAELYRAARQYQPALDDLDHASRLDRSMAEVDLERARVSLEMRNPEAAAAAASRFLARRPAHAGALIIRGRAHAMLGHGRQAASDFTRALDTSPMPDLYIERARATQMGSGATGVENALGGLDDGIRRLGSIVTLEIEAIDLELKLARYDAALARLDRVSAQSSRKESWLARRAEILEVAGRIDEAAAAYRAALAAATMLPAWTQRTAASAALIERLRANIARVERALIIHQPRRR